MTEPVGEGRRIILCRATDVPEGAVVKVAKDGLALAVFHLGDRFYVTDDRCTHGPGSLSEGEIEGEVVVCNFHNGAFHIPSGRVARPPCKVPVRTYPVEIRDGQVCVELSDPAG